ncbi:MAG: AMP-binding protein, partial [Alphaproteobacteria bacterium]|nr:AMP-binding protein [Alphaproteobacteria bacterium]
MPVNPFEQHLPKTAANFQPMTPLSFLARAAGVYPDHPAVIHGKIRRNYSELYARSRQLASALAQRYVGVGDTVSVMLPNT